MRPQISITNICNDALSLEQRMGMILGDFEAATMLPIDANIPITREQTWLRQQDHIELISSLERIANGSYRPCCLADGARLYAGGPLVLERRGCTFPNTDSGPPSFGPSEPYAVFDVRVGFLVWLEAFLYRKREVRTLRQRLENAPYPRGPIRLEGLTTYAADGSMTLKPAGAIEMNEIHVLAFRLERDEVLQEALVMVWLNAASWDDVVAFLRTHELDRAR